MKIHNFRFIWLLLSDKLRAAAFRWYTNYPEFLQTPFHATDLQLPESALQIVVIVILAGGLSLLHAVVLQTLVGGQLLRVTLVVGLGENGAGHVREGVVKVGHPDATGKREG